MPDLGTTTVSLRARTQQFQRQIGSAGLVLRSFSREVGSAVRSVGLIAAGLAFGSAGIGGLVRGWADAATRLRELSLATDVAVPRLQQLQRIFEADGVAAEQFRFGFLRLNRTIGNALRNEFTATQVFQELGVAIREVDGTARNAADILQDVIPALAELPVTLQQSLGAELFGRTYIRLATAVARVTEEAGALTKEVERQEKLFGTISDDEAIQLKALSQSFVDAGNAAQYYGQQIAVAFGPDIIGTIEQTLQSIRENQERFIGSLVRIAQNIDLAVFVALAFAFRRIALAMGAAAAGAVLFLARFSAAAFSSAIIAARGLAAAVIVVSAALGAGLAAGAAAAAGPLATAAIRLGLFATQASIVVVAIRSLVVAMGTALVVGAAAAVSTFGRLIVVSRGFAIAIAAVTAALRVGIGAAVASFGLSIALIVARIAAATISMRALQLGLASLVLAFRTGITVAIRAFTLALTVGAARMATMAASAIAGSKAIAVIGAAMAAFSRAALAATLSVAKVIAGFAALAVVASYANQALQGNFFGFEEAIQDVIDGVERLYRVIADIATGDFALDDFDIGIDFAGIESDITNLYNQIRTVEGNAGINIRVQLETFGLENDLRLLQQRIVILSQSGDAAARTAVEYRLLNRINDEINTNLEKQRRLQDELNRGGPGLTFARAEELKEEIAAVNGRLRELNDFRANPEIFSALIDQAVEAEATIARLTAEREARVNIDVVYRPGAAIRDARNQLIRDISELQNQVVGGLQGVGAEIIVERELQAAAERYEEVTARITEANRQLGQDLPVEEAARLRAEIERLSELRINIGEFLANPQTRDNIREMTAEVQELQAQLDRYRQAQEFTNAASSAFTNSLKSVILGTKSGKEAVNSFILSLADLVLQYTVLIPLARQLSSALGGGAGGGIGGILGGIFGFASGGFGRGLSLVGERGPELVDLGSGSRVYSNEQLASAVGGQGGGTTVVNEFHIQSTDGPGVRRALQEALPVFTDAAVNKVMGESTRPGAVRKTLRGY